MRRLTSRHHAGQALVLFALVITVLFGVLALVVDLGIGMVQVRRLQNAADAGVMAGAKVMAESVTQSEGTIAYGYLTNEAVHDRVISFGPPNHLVNLPTFVYATAVQFRDCSTPPASLGYTATSDATLVAALGGTRLASASTKVPNNACSIKVTDQVTFPAYFAVLLGFETQTVAARAAARVAPTSAPTQITGTWPITHWGGDPDTSCNDQAGSLCTFWDSNAPPGGNFKQAVNMSRYSELPGAINRKQHWVDYDHLRPGTRNQIPDLQGWLRYGWGGHHLRG